MSIGIFEGKWRNVKRPSHVKIFDFVRGGREGIRTGDLLFDREAC